jgi:hypothetical protein
VGISASSWFDSTPPGPVENDHPVMHDNQGGQGTYADPISASLPGAALTAFPPGTRFYLPSLQRYIVAEDFGEPAGGPPNTDTTLNIWVDGRDGTAAEASDCEGSVTADGQTIAQVNPPPGLPVIPGPIAAKHTCNIPPS